MIKDNKGKYFKEKEVLGELFQVEVGDTKAVDFYPQVKMMRWDNEANCSIRLTEFGSGLTPTDNNGIVSWRGDNVEVLFYELADESGFELECNFTAKPVSPTINFSIESKGLRFVHQPPLTKEELDGGAYRPPEAINSYAVFHESQVHNNYRSGKAFHIFRPWIEDANQRVWCDLVVTADSMAITIPAGFYKNADWSSVKLDPTLGYTSIGASIQSAGGSPRAFRLGAMSEDGDTDDLNIYIQDMNSASREGAFGFYSEAASEPDALLYTGGRFTDSGNDPGWRTEALTVSLTSGATYYAATFAENNASDIFYDTDAGYDIRNSSGSFPTFPDPFSQSSTTSSRRVSAYINYTASGGGGATGKSNPLAGCLGGPLSGVIS